MHEPTLSHDPARERSGLWAGPLVLGMLIFAFGVVAILTSAVAGVAAIAVAGAMLIAGGVAELVHAFRVRGSGTSLRALLAGLLSLVVGVLVLLRPMVGLASVTLLVAGFFFVSGLFRLISAIADRYGGWGWDFGYGLVAIICGVLIMASWPVSSLWVVGTLVGVELLVRGGALMAIALSLRRGLRALAT